MKNALALLALALTGLSTGGCVSLRVASDHAVPAQHRHTRAEHEIRLQFTRSIP